MLSVDGRNRATYTSWPFRLEAQQILCRLPKPLAHLTGHRGGGREIGLSEPRDVGDKDEVRGVASVVVVVVVVVSARRFPSKVDSDRLWALTG